MFTDEEWELIEEAIQHIEWEYEGCEVMGPMVQDLKRKLTNIKKNDK